MTTHITKEGLLLAIEEAATMRDERTGLCDQLISEQRNLVATVADQAAALAERDKDADVRTGDTLITAEHMTLTECQIALWIVLRKHRNKGKVYISRDEWDQAIGQRLEIGEYASGNVFIAALAASVKPKPEQCPNCMGHGNDIGWSCPYCNGTGFVLAASVSSASEEGGA